MKIMMTVGPPILDFQRMNLLRLISLAVKVAFPVYGKQQQLVMAQMLCCVNLQTVDLNACMHAWQEVVRGILL